VAYDGWFTFTWTVKGYYDVLQGHRGMDIKKGHFRLLHGEAV
jgi:hypothetical protein